MTDTITPADTPTVTAPAVETKKSGKKSGKKASKDTETSFDSVQLTQSLLNAPTIIVEVAKLEPSGILPIDLDAYAGDAATPIFATEDIRIPPNHNKLIKSKIGMGIPDDCVGMVCSRSGMAAKSLISVLNAPGIVDPNYTGDITVNLMNHNPDFTYVVKKGDNIAQLLFIPFRKPAFKVVDTITKKTDRGAKGHGSSGK